MPRKAIFYTQKTHELHHAAQHMHLSLYHICHLPQCVLVAKKGRIINEANNEVWQSICLTFQKYAAKSIKIFEK